MKIRRKKWDNILKHIQEDKPLTTFEISQICGVVHSTVSNWIDGGKLTAFKTVGGHRRVKKEALLLFLKLHEIPVSEEILSALKGEVLEPESAEVTDAPGSPIPTKKVVIIEDDEDISEILFHLIQASFPNVQIFRAMDGFEAGKLMATEMPDLVILDLILPGVDGFRILQSIRQDKNLSHTRIIATTGYDEAENRERILLAGGVDGFLVKPIDLETFKSKVRTLLYS